MAVTSLAECEKVQAFDLLGRLFIVADGHKPTPCHMVRVVQNPILIFPPQYMVQWEQPKPCPDLITPYHTVGGPFTLPSSQKSVKVAYLREGKSVTEDVEVKIVRAPAAGGGGDAPTPFAAATPAVTSPATDTARGYSTAFSFEEAFMNAIHNLPKRKPSHPDELETIEVKKIGAEFGGIVGFNHMFVEVERTVF
jgi:hypothetical protein